MSPQVLQCGNCERLKAATHALAFGIAGICATYNLAAWLVRRQRHLAINAALYTAATFWEAEHVRHHLAACHPPKGKANPAPEELRAAS